ncbi:DapH/DapD/GlmU-related protein [Algoriphagus sp. Y33]|uniref:acyltransferase n=1 Tax=Algoriphagus sp. Y33 TaxID=2772483 RepID=UPI001CE17CAD|nr:acyltransferase [Algoriphagus sp. Y33]
MLKTIYAKLKTKQSQLEQEGEPSGLGNMIGYSISGVRQLLMARWYFSRNSVMGKMLMVKGRPQVQNKGRIIFGDHVKLWSVFQRSKIFVKRNACLEIGSNSFINGAHLSVSESVIIGKHVNIGPYSIIIDDDFHPVDAAGTGILRKPIVIEDHVWITMNCMIMKGVRIGKGAVVAAGAVVTRDVPPHTLVGGVPAKVIRNLN